jgi:hypothetical protein
LAEGNTLMPHITGWLGLGTFEDAAFKEYGGYVRPPFRVSGDQPCAGRIERFPAPTSPINAAISHGALFDHPTNPRHLLTWEWLRDFAVVPTPARNPAFDVTPSHMFQALDVVIEWAMTTQHALNASEMPSAPDKITIEKGTMVGRFNGMPITTSLRLAVISGSFIARAALPTKQRSAA